MRACPTGLAALMLLVLVGCGSSGSPDTDGGGGAPTGSVLRVLVTDAPFPYEYVERATVTIVEVRVRDREDDGWETVFEGEETIDLVPLQNGVTHLLVEADIGPGVYDEVRLIVDAGEVELSADAVVADGDPVFSTANGKLHFPSGAQTGVKVKVDTPIEVTAELSGDLVLDFDLGRNFVFNGPVSHPPGVKRVIFTPVVRATNATTAGSLRLTVLSDAFTPGDTADDVPLQGATVGVFDDAADPDTDEPVVTGSTAEDGTATFSLAPGTYQLVVEAGGHAPGAVTGVDVVLANLTDVGDVVLAATGEISGVVMSDGGTPGDETDDVVVAGVRVEVREAGGTELLAEDLTDESGQWQIVGLASGAYDLTFAAPGFVDGELLGVASEATSPGYTVVLEALTTVLSGTVQDADANPLADVAVTAVNAAGTEVASTTTASDGTYALTLATGTYAVTFQGAAASTTENVTIEGTDPAGSQTLDITL